MRGSSLTVAALTVLGTVLVVPPAQAGDTTYHVVRQLDERTTVVGYACDGSPGDLPDVQVGTSPIHVRGQGSALLSTDALGGLVVHDPRPLRGVFYPAYAVGGTAPEAQWRVEVDDDVLTSDPVALAQGKWTDVWLEDATLHGAGGFTGSINDYIARFGHHGHWSAGLLTGGCLGSTEVRYDTIGTRRGSFDFEGQHWLTIGLRGTDGTNGAILEDGQTFRLTVRANDLGGPVGGARLVLQERGWDAKHWTSVGTRRTNAHGVFRMTGTADRTTWWRALWKRPGGNVPSGKALQASDATISRPRIDGHRCVDDPAVFGPVCRSVRVDGAFDVTGTGRPAGAASIRVEVHADDISGDVFQDRTVTLGRNGWRVHVRPEGHERLYLEVLVSGTSNDHFAGGQWEVPVVVR